MRIDLECIYCGLKWQMEVQSRPEIELLSCSTCQDTSLKVRDYAKSTINYYAGSPAFAPKEVPVKFSYFKPSDDHYMGFD